MEMSSITQLEKPKVFEELRSSPDGLTDDEAARRLDQFGRNVLKRAAKTPLPIRFARHLTNFFALLLWAAAIMSLIGGYISNDPGMSMIGYALTGVILLNAIFTFYQEFKAEKAAEALRGLLASKAKVIRNGKPREVEAAEIVPGDVIIMDAGDKVPADGRLIEENELRVNNSALTGESEPQPRTAGPVEAEAIESENLVFSGTIVVSGSGRGVVFATGMGTEFGKIAHLTQEIGEKFSPLQKEIRVFIHTISAIALILGVIFFFAGMATGRGFWINMIFAIGIIVANVPEGLLPTVTLTLSIAGQRMARRNALIKSLNDVETLGSTTVICTDKTGTLTRNEMTVRRIYANEREMSISGAGYEPKGKILDAGGRKIRKEDITNLTDLIQCAALCNESSLIQEKGRWKVIGDPTEGALLVLASKVVDVDGLKKKLPSVKINPFDSQRKMMSTINETGRGKGVAYVKGAVESILPKCDRILIEGKERRMGAGEKKDVEEASDRFQRDALRVIAIAKRDLKSCTSHLSSTEVENHLTFLGIIGMMDPPRKEVSKAVKRCKMAGIKIIVITGDSKETALSIARDVGVVEGNEPLVIEGRELTKMSPKQLKKKLHADEIIFARSTPKNKMDIVQALQEMGEVVAVTGDGVNDAPALKKADIGIAMGKAGTDVAKEAADMILIDDNFATIVNAIEEGRAVYDNIRRFVSYILTSNIPEIVPFIAFILLGIPLPLTVIQILTVDLGTDMVPATALGTEKPEKDVMTRPPRKRGERILKWSTLGRSYGLIGPIEAAASLVGYWLVLRAGGWRMGMEITGPLYMQATTACLAAIIITQVINGLVSRTTKESISTIGLFTNRNLLYGFASEIGLILAIVYLPPLQRIFGTQALNPSTWLIFIPFALTILGVEELRKYLMRRQDRGVPVSIQA